MSVFVAVDQIDKVFNLVGGGQYIALKGIDLQIRKGEFVSLIGHSGCGKSTLLNMIAGLDLPSEGVVALEGQQITKPGPDRMVVFQNYSLLPWRTVRENIALAVDSVMKHLPAGETSGNCRKAYRYGGVASPCRKTTWNVIRRTKTTGSDRPRPRHPS